MSDNNTIPNFSTDPESMVIAMRAMKEIIEALTGQRQAQGLGAPRVFVQPTPPTNLGGTALKRGDLWIVEGSGKVSFWDGRLWRPTT